MASLCEVYDSTKAIRAKEFNTDSIIEMLIGTPINLDIDNVAYTPDTVIVTKMEDDAKNRQIASAVRKQFQVTFLCKDNKMIFGRMVSN